MYLLLTKPPPHRGSICLNGKPGSVAEMHKLIAFVPQDDTMLTSLTVMELRVAVDTGEAPAALVRVPPALRKVLPRQAAGSSAAGEVAPEFAQVQFTRIR